jgi:hypothetical protein
VKEVIFINNPIMKKISADTMASGSAHRRLAVQKNGSGEQRGRDETTQVALCHKTSRKGTDFQTQRRKNRPEGGRYHPKSTILEFFRHSPIA